MLGGVEHFQASLPASPSPGRSLPHLNEFQEVAEKGATSLESGEVLPAGVGCESLTASPGIGGHRIPMVTSHWGSAVSFPSGRALHSASAPRLHTSRRGQFASTAPELQFVDLGEQVAGQHASSFAPRGLLDPTKRWSPVAPSAAGMPWPDHLKGHLKGSQRLDKLQGSQVLSRSFSSA